MIGNDAPLPVRTPGEKIDARRVRFGGAAHQRHHEVADLQRHGRTICQRRRSRTIGGRTNRFHARQAFVSQHQILVSRGGDRFGGRENFAIGAADSQLKRAAKNFAGPGISRHCAIDESRTR